jgi:hypothetical protein
VKWLNDTTPTQTIGAKTDIYGFCYDGTTVAGIQNSNFNF